MRKRVEMDSFYLDLPSVNSIEHTDNDVVNVILFLLESYFLELILQKAGSANDNIFLFSKKAKVIF